MDHIAADLFLLLVDNPSAQPVLERRRRHRLLAAAMLLDLALLSRLRPATQGDPTTPGRLLALGADGAMSPVAAQAFAAVRAKPLRPAAAIRKLGPRTEAGLVSYLAASGEIAPTALSGNVFRRQFRYPVANRRRVTAARSALLAALFERQPLAPSTAAMITVLHAVDGFGALLTVNDRGWRWVHARAEDIAAGSWLHESPSSPAEVNLAVTAASVRRALTRLA